MDWTQAHMLSLWAGFQLVNRKEFKRRLQSVKKALFDHFHRQVVAQWHRVQEGFFPFYFEAMSVL